MKYIKDDRNSNENYGIPEDLFLGLRIAEQPVSTDLKDYVENIIRLQKKGGNEYEIK